MYKSYRDEVVIDMYTRGLASASFERRNLPFANCGWVVCPPHRGWSRELLTLLTMCGLCIHRDGHRVADAVLESVEEKYAKLLGDLLDKGTKAARADTGESIGDAVQVCIG
jgi:hypothetical protein